MKLRAAVLIALVLVLATAWIAWSSSSTGEATTIQPSSSDARTVDREARDDESAPASETLRTQVDERTPAEIEAQVDARAQLLTGRVVDAQGSPIAGATVAASFSITDGFNALDLAVPAPSVVARATSARDGEFALEVESERSYQLEVVAPAFATERVGDCRAGQRVEVVLRRAASLFGRVTRRADGAPVAEARVEARAKRAGHGFGLRGARVLATTDADGRYRLDGLAPGEIHVDVEARSEASPNGIALEIADGATLEYDIALELGATIHGRVTDAITSLPIAGARVGQGWTFEKFVLSDFAGGYVFEGFSSGYVELTAEAAGYGKLEGRARDMATQLAVKVIDFALQPERTARGRIVDVDGAPIAGAYVAAVASEIEDRKQRMDWRSTQSDERGAFTLVGLRRDVRHALFARRAGFGVVVYDFPLLAPDAASIELGDIVLPPAATIAGVVVDALEQPQAHVVVDLHGSNVDRARLGDGVAANTWALDLYVAERTARTDALGRFGFADIAPGEYELSSRVDENHEAGAKHSLTVGLGASERDIVLVLDLGLSIEGRVIARDGGELPSVHISCDAEGGGRSADCEVARDGRFVVRGLSSMSYALTAYPHMSDAHRIAKREFVETRLAGIVAGSREVRLELRAAKRIGGRVLDAAGNGVAGAKVEVRDGAGVYVHGTTAKTEGGFSVLVLADEPVDLVASAPERAGEPPSRATLRGVTAQSRAIELRLAP